MSFWVAGATVVAGVGGAVVSSQGAKKAASASAAGSQAAIDEQRRQYDLTRGDLAPYRNIGNQALNALGSIYGYSPSSGSQNEMLAGASSYSPNLMKTTVPLGKVNVGGNLTQKLGGLGTILDPAAAIFGSKHGDENRNLKAFASESGVKQLEGGDLVLPDGTTFTPAQLKDVAGAWYGAKYAPDGDQSGWQQKYSTLLSGFQKIPGADQGQGQGGAPQQQLSAPDYSKFFESPDYQFRKQQGTQGIERSAAARGGAYSGNALKALAEFNSNLASGEFGNYFNRQASLAGIGQTATNATAAYGANSANQIGNALQNRGDARASGIAQSTNAIGQGLSGIAQGIGYYNANRKPASGLGTSNSPYNWNFPG